MNFLAHTYLSPKLNDILIGNYISDAVKGNQYKLYPKSIQEGILLHRDIDFYTDKHPGTIECKRYFSKSYGHHSSVLVDIVFDYFLASRWESYHNETLDVFSHNIYSYLKKKIWIMPPRLQYMTPYLIENNWFELYKSLKGVERVLLGMGKRTSMPQKSHEAIKLIKSNDNELYLIFNAFFIDISNKYSSS